MKKLKIGICDDEKIIVKLLESMVEECLVRKNIDADIVTFESGEELIEHVLELDSVFLDIQMPGLDGIETGKIIGKMNSSCKIIMASSKERYVEAIKINVFRYIMKPFKYCEIEEALEAIVAATIGMEKIQLFEKRMLIEVEQKMIQYIVAYDSYAEFILKNRVLRKDISLNNLEKIMDKRIFFRVHKKIIVNILSIQAYKNGVITIDEKEIPVSRRKKKEFEQAYMECDVNFR